MDGWGGWVGGWMGEWWVGGNGHKTTITSDTVRPSSPIVWTGKTKPKVPRASVETGWIKPNNTVHRVSTVLHPLLDREDEP